nr:MFS transporter [Streptomyces lydicus]
MTSYHAGGMFATGLGLTLAPALGWRWVFWAGVLPAVVAAPLLLRLLPESPGVLLAKGRTAEAEAVADRYGMARPAPVYAAANRVYPAAERATGLGWVTGIGRTGAVAGPWLGGTLAATANDQLGFTAFALAGLLGALAIGSVPLARRLGRRPATASMPEAAGVEP